MKRLNYISVYLRNSEFGPSDYYRIVQYLRKIDCNSVIHNALTNRQFQANLNCKKRILKKVVQAWLYCVIYIRRLYAIGYDLIRNPQIIIIQREVFPRFLPLFAGKLFKILIKKHRIIWDFDDEIEALGEISKREQCLLEEESEKIVVTHEYLREIVAEEYREKVILLPTTDKILDESDLIKVNSQRKKQYNDNVKVIWVGTTNTIKYMSVAIEYLDTAAMIVKKQYNKEMTLIIVSNGAYEPNVKYLKISNIRWSREAAIEAMLGAHIGIMPLTNTNKTLGKGGFKLIQYCAAGLPVVGSNVGFNKKIVEKQNGFLVDESKQDEWIDAIVFIASNVDVWEEFSKSSLNVYNRKFSFEKNLNVWKQLLN